jgi:hypothetical protein
MQRINYQGKRERAATSTITGASDERRQRLVQDKQNARPGAALIGESY